MKPVILKGAPLVPPASVATRYVKALTSLTAQMTAQVAREVRKLFDTDGHFGEDAAGTDGATVLMSKLTAKFGDLFASKAEGLAEQMVNSASRVGKSTLTSSLSNLAEAFTLKIPTSNPLLAGIYKASVTENVALIKSIPEQYLQKVEEQVMQSITTGKGLQDLIPALEEYEGMTHRRATNIALDQTRKTYNAINSGRMQSVGITQFMWHHSGGGAHPRPEHVQMDGEIFSFDDPPVIDVKTGERGLPGAAVNCRCFQSPVITIEKEKSDATEEGN